MHFMPSCKLLMATATFEHNEASLTPEKERERWREREIDRERRVLFVLNFGFKS